MRRHVVQEVEILAETAVGEPRPDTDYSLLDSVPGEGPAARPEPSWTVVAEGSLCGCSTLGRCPQHAQAEGTRGYRWTRRPRR